MPDLHFDVPVSDYAIWMAYSSAVVSIITTALQWSLLATFDEHVVPVLCTVS